ncbi:hypothetical protein CYMTET_9316 [Cymbomonas tetramitiformis]|uniref:Uncharacterized protein n=1 Tax=Cymbomonas tetramitiformis TaxID=36881 RepID=A0AAE0GRB4_9CHLO|nr:hypothetical protein CYMTET_9316 [Cymbomonas tetramitiformis]
MFQPDADTPPDPLLLHVVCPTSTYVRASGNLHDLCAQVLSDDPIERDAVNPTKHDLHLMLVDDAEENVVTVVSENIPNIGQEFNSIKNLDIACAEGVKSLHAACMCVANIVGSMLASNTEATIVLLLNDNRDVALAMLGDIIADGRDAMISTHVRTLDETFLNEVQDDESSRVYSNAPA